MRNFRLLFLLFVALLSSGYRWRCYFLCEDQTAIQNDYVEQRDQCRSYAQANLEAEMRKSANPGNAKDRKDKLINLFSECMGKYGWDVPHSDKDKFADKDGVPIYVSSVSKLAPSAGDAALAQPVSTVEQQDLQPVSPPADKQTKSAVTKTPPEKAEKKTTKSKSTKKTQKQSETSKSKTTTQKSTTSTKGQPQAANSQQTAVSAKSQAKPVPQAQSQQQPQADNVPPQPAVTAAKSQAKPVSQAQSQQQPQADNVPPQPAVTAAKSQAKPVPQAQSQQQPQADNVPPQPAVTAKSQAKPMPQAQSQQQPQADNVPPPQPASAAKPQAANNQTISPSATGSQIPAQPGTTKDKELKRAEECELARRSANISGNAATIAEECDAECTKLLKNAPKDKRPPACPAKDQPKEQTKDQPKDAVVNLLDVQLNNN